MPTDPTWQNSIAYEGVELRRADMMMVTGDGTALGGRSGLRPGDPGLAVSLAGSTINVAAGVAGLYRSGQGLYRANVPTATSAGTLNAAHASFTRLDLVYLRVWDTDVDSSGLRKADPVYLAGTASATPVLPSPAGTEIYIPLAKITVPQSGGGSASVQDLRPFTVAPGGILPTTSAPSTPYTGQYYDDGVNLRRWNGSSWQTYGPQPTWENWTPVWSGLSALGSSVSKGRVWKDGTRVEIIALLNWGTSSSLGTGTISISIPYTAASFADQLGWQGEGKFRESSSGLWHPMHINIEAGAATAQVSALRPADMGLVSPGSQGYAWGGSNALMRAHIVYESA
ncbi:hypothetical protein P1P75_11940 [Streptomyces sp. ID05-39B]|uniref:hypothetical protein n=1 Tax=Streptomyces sp. ID05-39B TaxID=3028664 RepID=UPI0029BF299F|nr:hypothetical protein [Streptomyces sp. ID05-39B]MDX3527134.1 hypothetical protein [Streptomyces sp. ID05-39B]